MLNTINNFIFSDIPNTTITTYGAREQIFIIRTNRRTIRPGILMQPLLDFLPFITTGIKIHQKQSGYQPEHKMRIKIIHYEAACSLSEVFC